MVGKIYQILENFRKKTQNYFLKFSEKIFFNEIFCFLVIMSKKASADQFSVSGGNLGQNRERKTDFLCGKDFFWGGSSCSSISHYVHCHRLNASRLLGSAGSGDTVCCFFEIIVNLKKLCRIVRRRLIRQEQSTKLCAYVRPSKIS